jgi:hypothetical protein
MGLDGIQLDAKVYCEGGWHEPASFRFHGRVLKSDLIAKIRSIGWTVSNGHVYCPRHRDPKNRVRQT